MFKKYKLKDGHSQIELTTILAGPLNGKVGPLLLTGTSQLAAQANANLLAAEVVEEETRCAAY